MSDRDRLTLAELGEWNIDIADIDIDDRFTRFDCGITGDVTRRFAVANEVE